MSKRIDPQLDFLPVTVQSIAITLVNSKRFSSLALPLQPVVDDLVEVQERIGQQAFVLQHAPISHRGALRP